MQVQGRGSELKLAIMLSEYRKILISKVKLAVRISMNSSFISVFPVIHYLIQFVLFASRRMQIIDVNRNFLL